MNKSIKSIGKTILLINLLAIISSQAACAQQYKASQEAQQNPEYKFQQLKSYQQLPEFPQYSGQAEFKHGVLYPQARGGMSVTYNLQAREDKQTVLRWYQDALKIYHWNLSSEQAPDSVHAARGGATVEVMATQSAHRGYGADIFITYRSTR